MIYCCLGLKRLLGILGIFIGTNFDGRKIHRAMMSHENESLEYLKLHEPIYPKIAMKSENAAVDWM